MHFKETAQVVRQDYISTDVYSIWLQTNKVAAEAKAGQFVSLYCKDGSRLLPRPISICQIDKEKNRICLVYRVAGGGTKEFSRMHAGDTVEIMGPLGNGFTIKDRSAMLIAGGIGIPPMVELAKQLHGQGCDVIAVAGYRNREVFLDKELEKYAHVVIATEDGSVGVKGNVMDAIEEQGLKAEEIYACGPMPMLRAIKKFALREGIEAQLSMEEKMACGIGACLACVCQSTDVDEHTNVHNKRVCKDGPVFFANEIEL